VSANTDSRAPHSSASAKARCTTEARSILSEGRPGRRKASPAASSYTPPMGATMHMGMRHVCKHVHELGNRRQSLLVAERRRYGSNPWRGWQARAKCPTCAIPVGPLASSSSPNPRASPRRPTINPKRAILASHSLKY